MEGTVNSFLTSKGYGFLRGDDGRDYFVHHRDIVGANPVIEGQRVAFEESATPKGYRARRVRPVEVTGATGYVLPEEVLTTRHATLKGWEVLVESRWIISGASRDSPDAAMQILRERARCLGATAVLNVEYSKMRGSESGSGSGTHYFTIHHFDGRPVVVGKPSVHGQHHLDALVGLDARAAQLKKALEAKTQRSRDMATLVVTVILVMAGSACLFMPGIPGWVGLLLFVFVALFSIALWPAMVTDHDRWLALDE